MILLRLACILLPELADENRNWVLLIGNVTLRTLRSFSAKDGIKLLVGAQIELDHYPKVTSDNFVVIPDKARINLEEAIINIGNLISLSTRGKRTISSPAPCVVLIPEIQKEIDWLNKAKGVHYPQVNRFEIGVYSKYKDFKAFTSQLQDRLDGVALLAESLAHNHLVGKLHEYMRLFERAFKSSSKMLIGPLSQFLANSPFLYSEAEIESWIIKIRHPATHADLKDFLVESDVRLVIKRIEQAAYDVLFNKDKWRDPDIGRRKVWTPPYGTSSDKGDLFSTGGAANLAYEVLDEFLTFPRDGEEIDPIPSGWWSPYEPAAIESHSVNLTILPDPIE